MTITNYATLQTAIADFLNRQDLAATVPTFIRLAEARIDRELRHWRQERRSNAMIDVQYSAIPDDYLRPIRLQILDAETSEIAPISTAQMLQLRGDRSDRAGRPTHYALTAGSLEVYPTPDAAYTTSMVYYGRIPALSDANTTNWLLSEAPDVYLYGSLLHSAPYLKDDQRAAIWEGLFVTGLENLSLSSEEAKYGGSGLRMRTRRGSP